nr:hypothetical protein [Tanacetum cinerariifolium]
MEEMRMNLPGRKGGLSIHYDGKSRTFQCMRDVHCLDDLKKQDRSINNENNTHVNDIQQQQMTSPCRPRSNTNLCGSPIIGL